MTAVLFTCAIFILLARKRRLVLERVRYYKVADLLAADYRRLIDDELELLI